jgi:hypothetical protein
MRRRAARGPAQQKQNLAQQKPSPGQQNPNPAQQNPNPTQQNPNDFSDRQSRLFNGLSPNSGICGLVRLSSLILQELAA